MGDCMSDKRDNNYFRKRLLKDSQDKLVQQVDAGEISMYEATIKAGYRKTAKKQGLDLLESEWAKLSRSDRQKFVARNLRELDEIIKRVGALILEHKKVQEAKE